MKKILYCCFLQAIVSIAWTQETVVVLQSQIKADNSVEISYRKYRPGSYTVVLNFSTLTNVSYSTETKHTIPNEQGVLITLRPQDKNQSINYRYTYSYIAGELNPKIQTNFPYLLPFKPGTKAKVFESGYAYQMYFGANKPEDWKCYEFRTATADSILASRKGLVVEVVDKYEQPYVEGVEFTTNENYLIVEHEDGTLMRYLGFKQGSFSVKHGQLVFPGTPLGIISERRKNYYRMSLLLYSLQSADMESYKNQTLSNHKSLYKIGTPQFVYDDNATGFLIPMKDYTTYSNEEYISKEMSKRELKKYKTGLK